MLRKSIAQFLGFEKAERVKKTPAEKLLMSTRATAKSRYAASNRLKSQSHFSFFTTTVLSLGLIFIPLMQNSNIQLGFPNAVLNMMQIFLAVAVLVYSITISKAGYEVRAEKLNICGDKLKDLGRKLDDALKNSTGPAFDLEPFRQSYSDIVTDAENHSRTDYQNAMLDMPNDYNHSGMKKISLNLQIFVVENFNKLLPIMLMLIELSFITEMLGVTSFYPPTLKSQSMACLS